MKGSSKMTPGSFSERVDDSQGITGPKMRPEDMDFDLRNDQKAETNEPGDHQADQAEKAPHVVDDAKKLSDQVLPENERV